jgi:peptidoglycan/xylan/chitin deacetylase (PgdA/CDA1 family)
MAAAGLGILGCREPSPPAGAAGTAPKTPAASEGGAGPAVLDAASQAPPSLTQINGQAFPDHVLALTWDDGPDEGSLALAEYLRYERVSGTFFVVKEWAKGVSSDPGEGGGVYATGYEHIPILGRLVALGHRLGNHTLHHVLLTDVAPSQADDEVRANQEEIEPFLTNELRLFRAPGGAWNAAAASAIANDPYLARLVGPIRWDVDRKDWEGSLSCSGAPSECEDAPVPSHSRVKPRVMAERYLESIDEAKHGIVLFHDRVGDVGSRYAIDLARIVIPALKARGYVFAAPVLAFSPLALRDRRDGAARSAPNAGGAGPSKDVADTVLAGVDRTTIRLGDLNGDGRPDVCGRGPTGIVCALAFPTGRGFTTGTIWLSRGMSDDDGWRGASEARRASIQLADVNGDGRADLCADSPDGVVCGLAP